MEPAAGIDGLIARMEALLGQLGERGDANRHFLATYLRTTRAVKDELAAGGFLDRAWVERWDVAFADLYLNALEVDQAGRRPPEPWAIAFGAARDQDLPPLRHLLLRGTPARGGRLRPRRRYPAKPLPRAISRRSSALSSTSAATPRLSATSRSDRPELAAALAIAAASS
jgi:Family of unknown function (DUF5995)